MPQERRMKGFTLVELLVSVAILLVMVGYFIYEPFVCARRWPDTKTNWDFIVGCQVQVDGKFAPEKNVRQF